MKKENMVKEIIRLKNKKNALILVHNYQKPEIYEVADFIGDSYGLSVQASRTEADIIVFCGVRFMAETAYILNPGKKILLPAGNAGCPMADTVNVEDIRTLRAQYPDAAVVSYMNTTAETKAESDIICTSSNAVKIVNSLPHRKIIFVPDKNLADFVAGHTDKEIIPWRGFCYVHSKFSAAGIKKGKKMTGGAKVVVHPECTAEVRRLADHICSTSGMIHYAKKDEAKKFIIATETGMLEMLKREVPGKEFYAAPPGSTCLDMKRNSLEIVLESLKKEEPVVTVPEETRRRAQRALDKMLEVGV